VCLIIYEGGELVEQVSSDWDVLIGECRKNLINNLNIVKHVKLEFVQFEKNSMLKYDAIVNFCTQVVTYSRKAIAHVIIFLFKLLNTTSRRIK
jgi:hypothetical protein